MYHKVMYINGSRVIYLCTQKGRKTIMSVVTFFKRGNIESTHSNVCTRPCRDLFSRVFTVATQVPIYVNFVVKNK